MRADCSKKIESSDSKRFFDLFQIIFKSKESFFHLVNDLTEIETSFIASFYLNPLSPNWTYTSS